MSENVTALFLRFREHNDMRALARVFDRTAPELASVAAHLARSAADAEDLVQATFLAAIEGAESYDAKRPLVPWLMGILSMQARKQRERSSREVDPERVHQPSPAGPEAQVEAFEITSAVDAAVSQLDARYAGLVRRHLLDGAPPAELAREFELSGIATRVRLHRGLKQLRKLMPVSMAGAAFGASLLRVDLAAIRGRVLRRAAQLTGAAVPVGSVASVGLMLALLVPIAVATPAWLLWRTRTTEVPSTAIELVATPKSAAPEAPANSASASNAVETLALVEPDPVRNSSPAPIRVRSDQAIVRGRFLRADGTPASGASLEINSFAGVSSQDPGNGETVPWTKPPVSTNAADGSFEVAFDVPAGYQFSLSVTAPECARAQWRWGDLAAGTVRDLGEVRLEAAGSLLARVVNEQGATLFQGWSVTARMDPPNQLLGRRATYVTSTRNVQSSNFRLDGLCARRVAVTASHGSGASTEKKSFEVLAGQTTPIELVYRGPDLQHRITVRVSPSLKTPFFLQPAHVWIEQQGSAPIAAQLRPQSIGDYSADGLAAGQYRVRIEDPRLVEWTKDDVQPGETISASPKGNAAIRLTILDADQTPYAGRYRLSVLHYGNSTPGGNPPLVAADADAPANGLVGEIWPGSYSMELRIAGRSPKQFDVANLQAFETRNVLLTFAETSSIHGRVLASDGTTPLADVDVQLTPGELAGHTLGAQASVISSEGQMRQVQTRAKTDAGGHFQFDGLQPGNWTLRAHFSRWLTADRTLALPDSSSVEIVEPPSGFFSGRLLLPEQAPLADTMLEVYLLGGSHHIFEPRNAPEPDELHADGTFRLGPIPVGQVHVSLMVFSQIYDGLGDGKTGTGPQLGLYEIQVGEPTPVEIDVRSIFPAHMHGSVRIDGQPAITGSISARGINPSPALQGGSSAVTVEGLYSMGGITPGHELALEYSSPQGWSWTSPQPVSLAPAADTNVDLAFETVEREIQIVDATTHLPVANQRIAWRATENVASSGVSVIAFPIASSKTDAQGKLRVRMPVGTARPVAVPDGPPTNNAAERTFTPATVEWSNGSATIVLELTQH